jgi:molybdenum cofactor cytidylyltransferase
MRFEGQLVINAPRAAVWAFLTDPEAVGRCAPGVQSLEIIEPRHRFRVVASVGFGAVKAAFVTDAEWLQVEEPSRASMKVHGTAPGSAMDATSEMRLDEAPGGGTQLRWSADVSVVGTIASLAARLMGGIAQKLTNDFFDSVRKKIETLEAPSAGFRFGPVPLEDALGKILGHNIAGTDGRRLLRKGRPLAAEDVEVLRAMGRRVVYVAEMGPGDVGEDEAARRIATAALGPGLELSGPFSARANLLASGLGVLRVDPARLVRLNEIDGITVATLLLHSPVRPRQVAATVKVIPFAVPEESVRAAEAIAAEGGPLLRVDAIAPRAAGLVLSGSPSVRERVLAEFDPPLRSRLLALGSEIRRVDFVPLEDEAGEEALAQALQRQIAEGAALVILAGETAIVDRHDIAPRAIERAGGEVVCFGAPVDPGNLLLLAYLGTVPVLGAPGCARSRKTNVIDWVLPRLLAGERLDRSAVVALGHGGLLEDAPERPMPRGDV